MKTAILFILSGIVLNAANAEIYSVACAQKKSVRPSINDDFHDPDIEKWVGRFEVESREILRDNYFLIYEVH